MIRLYDTYYLIECETDRVNNDDILLSEINTVEEVDNELKKAINFCENKYHTKAYYSKCTLIGNVESTWDDTNTKLVVTRTYDKWYITIDWGSHSHFIRIAFDTEKEYKDYMSDKYGW